MMDTNKCCGTCEFCMPVNGELLCAGGLTLPDGRNTYGMKIDELEKLFPNGCDDYNESYLSYLESETRSPEEIYIDIMTGREGEKG